MARYSYDEYIKQVSQQESNQSNFDSKVGYFSLRDNGDEAIVRFDYSTPQEFEVIVVHSVEALSSKGKKFFRKVSCLRTVNDPAEKCPLCATGNRVASKAFVRVLVYEKDEHGTIVPTATVWERPASFLTELKGLMDEWGDLRNLLFKVKRNGARGSMDTKYQIVLLNSAVYKPEIYVADFSGFKGYNAIGHAYVKKTAEEILTEFLDVPTATPTTQTPTKESQPATLSPTPTPTLNAPETSHDTSADPTTITRPTRHVF